MLGILEVAVAAAAASGTQEDEKEAPKVCQTIERSNPNHKNTKMNHHGASTGPSSVFKIVKMIMERNFQPVIIFSFSKKECEAYALQVAKLDFNTGM